MAYHSQTNQDSWLESVVFKGFRNGFFVDVGAHDGVTINNTLFFEEARGWSGINVEPIKEVFGRLMVNRPRCANLNCAISSTDGAADFILNVGHTEMLSGLEGHYDPRHRSRLRCEMESHGGSSTVISVETRRLETIFDERGVAHIHYLSIDVEGAEHDVVKSINFDKVFIDVIGFENNYRDASAPIVEYLRTKGYDVVLAGTDIFMVHQSSQFR